jgi:hypothetical protein
VSHRGADELSGAIDEWLSRGDVGSGAGLAEVVDALGEGLPSMRSDDARERVRRRLATVSPRPRSAQELLLERAFDELNLIQGRLRDEEYVPLSALVGAAVVIVGAVGLTIWLRRRGLGEPRLSA